MSSGARGGGGGGGDKPAGLMRSTSMLRYQQDLVGAEGVESSTHHTSPALATGRAGRWVWLLYGTNAEAGHRNK
eukprot:29849-Chlamydomonas_euryale.AAC.2